MKRRNLIQRAVGSAVFLSGMTALKSFAANFPTKYIRIVCPFGAGGVADIMARTLAIPMSKSVGQQFIIENKGGVGGSIGAAEVARAAPDGYTMLLGNSSSHCISPGASAKPLYDPLADFEFITSFATVPLALVVHPSLPVNSVSDLVKLVKASPNTYSYGSSGTGGILHLVGELFKIKAGLPDMQHIPYKGEGPEVVDLLAGVIKIGFVSIAPLIPHQQAGTLKILCYFSPEPVAQLKGVPTSKQAGYPDILAEAFYMWCAPAKTPPEAIQVLKKATDVALKDPVVLQTFAKAGVFPIQNSGPEDTRNRVKEEIAKWAPIIKANKITME